MTELLTPEHFLPHVGKTVRVKGGSHAFTLVAVERRKMQDWERAQGLREPFNLIFRGPAGGVLPEGTYTLEIDDGPAFDLYVNPVHTPQRDRQNYQASFN